MSKVVKTKIVKSKESVKKSTKDETVEKKPRNNFKEGIMFIYHSIGQTKSSIILRPVRQDRTPKSEYEDLYKKFYGRYVKINFIKCENAEKTLKDFYVAAKKLGFKFDEVCGIIVASVNNVSKILKDLDGTATIVTRVKDMEIDPEKPLKKVKGNKSSNKDCDDIGEDDEDGTEVADDVQQDENVHLSKQVSEQGSEQVSEPVKVVKKGKRVAKKTD